jgi:ABC-2 type transport system ATP-binding protein
MAILATELPNVPAASAEPSFVSGAVGHATTGPDSGVPRLRVDGATHSYGNQPALRGISLALYPGEIYGLLGPNGAGKSTLMKAICGRFTLDSGSVRLDGADPTRSSAARRRIGFVPQEIALYSHLTVAENLAVFARLAGVARRNLSGVIALALADTGLTRHRDVLCRALSGGYQRRLNICASLLHQPPVLVLDEPTVGIDIDAREAIHALLRKLKARGTAILLTTHELDQAEALADRVGIMNDGRMLLEGVPEVLLKQAFGGYMELIAVLGKVTAAQVRLLVAHGFTAGGHPGSWMALANPEGLDLAILTRELTAAGLAVKELRMRAPDLASLFQLTVKPNDPAVSDAAAEPGRPL